MSTSGSCTETDLSDPLTVDACSRRVVILVNGLPAAGKTTLARALSRRLSLPLFSKDVIKEAHADIFGAQPPDGRPQRSWNSRFGAAANATMWGAAGRLSRRRRPRVHLAEPGDLGSRQVRAQRRGSARATADLVRGAARPRQGRFAARQPARHPIHGEPPDEEEWSGRWALARPLPIPDTLHVDTTGPVDLDAITDWCRCPR